MRPELHRRAAVLVIVAAFGGIVGPKLTLPGDRDAGEPFGFDVPAGFVEKVGASAPSAERQWTYAGTLHANGLAPTISVSHSPSGGVVEEPALSTIAGEMRSMLEPSGVAWRTLRTEVRTRPDGARVGLLEGECVKRTKSELAPGIAAELHYRRLILVFPDDAGTSIVTALYGIDDIATWQPLFEGSLATARGVARRVPSAPWWLHAAWAAAGLVLGWLGLGLLTGRAAKREHA